MDDLTVRCGQVIHGEFFSDEAAEKAAREACAKRALGAPQGGTSALEALGVKTDPKRAKHDATVADQNHPTQMSYSLNSLKGDYMGDSIRDYYRGY